MQRSSAFGLVTESHLATGHSRRRAGTIYGLADQLRQTGIVSGLFRFLELGIPPRVLV